MSDWVGPLAPISEDPSPYRPGADRPSHVRVGLGTPPSRHLLKRLVSSYSHWLRRTCAPRPPSMAIFSSLAVAVTLLIGMVASATAAHISGEMPGSFKGLLLVVVSLPVALLVTIVLSVALPYRAYASTSTPVALVASYCPYALGALTGIWVALWLGQVHLLGYDPLAAHWKGTVGLAGPLIWLVLGLLSNHLGASADRGREYQRGMEELRESRHRMVVIHEQTRKEIAGLLHGRVQSRLIVLGHWLKECQARLKDRPHEAAEKLGDATELLKDIRDQELRSITRQLYPSIIRTGLLSVLSSLADRFHTVFEIHLDVDKRLTEMESASGPGLDEQIRLTLYRVAEEALSNAAKYSQAREATLRAYLSPLHEAVLEVEDDGEGFRPQETPPGQGLLSMEDYVTALGGRLEVRSSPGTGTTVSASVPISSYGPVVKAVVS